MTNNELIEKTDKAISELVIPKYELQKAYNYYNGIRDAEQFRYLEENFGIGNPTSVQFTPLIKKHIDVLIGEYLGIPILPRISCKDKDTITNIYRDKQLTIKKQVVDYLTNHLKNQIYSLLNGKDMEDQAIVEQLNKVKAQAEESFVSEYERASQNVLEYIMQSRNTDFHNVLRDLLLDILITGYSFYKVDETPNQSNIKIRVLSPLNVFPDRNIDSPYIKDSYRVVIRNWLTKQQILNKYGKDLSKKDKELLENSYDTLYDNSSIYVRNIEDNGIPATSGLQAGKEITPGYPTGTTKVRDLIPVYEVEWIETDKDYVMQRYSTIRIGEEIYILKGLDTSVIRSSSNPSYCSLSVNGICFLNRGLEPYSLMLSCAHLQDRYDLLCFYRDNLIANSGTVGDWIDETLIPSNLGVDFSERLTKWISYKKQGIALLNTSDEGRQASGAATLNTIFNGYDDTVKAQAIQAIQLAIEAIENTACSITGVFKERLNGIEQRDAVTNVKVSQNNSFNVTKQYYHQMDMLVNEILLDCLNKAKTVFKSGLVGTIILGDNQQRIFTADPQYFTISDYDIRIDTSSEVMRDIEYIKQLIPSLIQGGALQPDIIFEAITTKSLADLKNKVKEALYKQKEENNKLQQALQKCDQLEKEGKKIAQELEKAQAEIKNLNKEKLELQKQEVLLQNKLEWYKAETERTYRESLIKESKRRTDVEIAQLTDGNPFNNKIRKDII